MIINYNGNVTKMEMTPPPTMLYSLEPIGIGTEYIESLTSYICRLAREHHMSVLTLVNKCLFPSIDYIIRDEKVFEKSKSYNSDSEVASKLVKTLEIGTGIEDLNRLTTQRWEYISSQKLLKPTKAWCPMCYYEARQTKQVIYDPLIWFLDCVNLCPKHYIKLQGVCPFCKKKNNYLNSYSNPGFCLQCNAFLGHKEFSETVNKEDFRKNQFIISNISEFVIHMQREQIPKDYMLNKIKELIMTYGENINEIAKLTGIRYESLRRWLKAKETFQLDSLLKLSYGFGIPLKQLLKNQYIINPDQFNNVQDLAFRDNTFSTINRLQIEKELLDICEKDNIPTIKNICECQ